jgi:L-ascorbate metabolism protein UlaG (beta-lactamase superfamily)
MQVEWYGQSAFRLAASGTTVFIDPFADLSGLAARGMRFEYPPIGGIEAHLGDFGQSALHDEQAVAIGRVDLLFIPVGGGPTIGAEQAAAVTERLDPLWVVPMHYRTARIDFLETAEPFLERISHVQRLDAPRFDIAELPGGKRPLAVVPAAP